MEIDWFKLYVLLNVAVITLLALNISRLRIQLRVANSDGGKPELKKAIRAHGNGVEHVLPFGLLVFCLQDSSWLAVLVIGFTVARVMHFISMLGSFFNLRRIAALLTYGFEIAGLAVLSTTLF